MYNYFIKTSDNKVHKYHTPMQWMDANTFGEFLLSVRSETAKFVKSWRVRDGSKQKNNKRAKRSS